MGGGRNSGTFIGWYCPVDRFRNHPIPNRLPNHASAYLALPPLRCLLCYSTLHDGVLKCPLLLFLTGHANRPWLQATQDLCCVHSSRRRRLDRCWYPFSRDSQSAHQDYYSCWLAFYNRLRCDVGPTQSRLVLLGYYFP